MENPPTSDQLVAKCSCGVVALKLSIMGSFGISDSKLIWLKLFSPFNHNASQCVEVKRNSFVKFIYSLDISYFSSGKADYVLCVTAIYIIQIKSLFESGKSPYTQTHTRIHKTQYTIKEETMKL